MALTVKGIAKKKQAGRYYDKNNLFLQVTESGGKSWLFKYPFRKRSREMGLGPYPDVDLEEARARAEKYRHQLKRDRIDPLASRKKMPCIF